MIHCNSNHSMQQRIACLKSLKNRMFLLSHASFYGENVRRFNELAKLNDYPKRIINNILFNTSVSRLDKTLSKSKEEIIQWSKFPYIYSIRQTIKKLLRKVDIRIAFYPLLKISSLYANLKQKRSIGDLSSVIYRIPCRDCEKTYVGTTKNKLSQRLKQHINDCKSKNSDKPNRTALSHHHFNHNHRFDFDSPTVLHTERNTIKRYLAETVCTRLENNSVNFRTDTQDLSVIYAGLLC